MFINELFTNEPMKEVVYMFNELDVLMSGHQFKKLYEKKYDEIMRKYNLRKIEIEILYFISNCGEHNTAKDIANLQYISKAHISNSIDDMTHKKYLSIIEDSQDRRYLHLSLTEAAKPVIEEIEMVRNQLFEILFQGISEDERQLIHNISKRIVKNIGEELKK
jgi:DNA-binding MarR family transcriptional regulator